MAVADLPGWQSARTLPSPHSGFWPTETGHKLPAPGAEPETGVALADHAGCTATGREPTPANPVDGAAGHDQQQCTAGRPAQSPSFRRPPKHAWRSVGPGPARRPPLPSLLQEPTRIPGR